ncbi:5'-methylthioadenosine/adenosylhomocysteine nucleosidase [Peptostreptococcaceae bacterium OttesenSCG-928-C18]|nr:5'-methylthioadenosine/adenosylhomocysteine nucleosidase [Peptostreptococcaceae bacterium OttesenSCG-928-C18]
MPGKIKVVGIVSALDSEINEFRKVLNNIEEKIINKHKFNIGLLEDIKVIFIDSGVGKVNSAITTQTLIDNFSPDIIINTGIAGGLDRKLKHTDLVIANELTYHDFDLRILEEYFPFVRSFKVEEKYLEISRKILKNCKYYEGLIITGDQFVTDSNKQLELREKFGAVCVEMEGASIAHTAFSNGIPFFVVRCISDMADDDGESDYDNFEILAAKKASDFTIKFIKTLK